VTSSARPRWDQRRFVSLGALFSALALPVTGLGNHLARHSSGPHADASWVVAHVAIGSLFVIFAAWHIVINRRAIVRYLRAKATRPTLPCCEVVAAVGLVGGVLVLALASGVA